MKIFTLKLRTLRFILKVLGSVRSTCKVLRLSQIKILGHSSTARRLVTLLCPSVCAHVTARLGGEGCSKNLIWGGGAFTNQTSWTLFHCKAPSNFVISVRLCACNGTACSTGRPRSLIWGAFTKICQENPDLVNIGQNVGPKYVLNCC